MATDLNTSIRSEQILKHTLIQEDVKPDAFTFQMPVIDKDLTTPPGGESEGDRYIIKVFSWDLLDVNCANISNWSDNDFINGESTQVTFDTQSCFKFDTNAASAANEAIRRKLSMYSNNYSIEIKIYLDAISASEENSFSLYYNNGIIRFLVNFRSDGLFVYSGGSYNEAGANLAVQDTWQTWRFDVTGGTAGTAKVNIYLNNILQASDVECINADAGDPGRIELKMRGANVNDRIGYVDYIKIGTNLPGNWLNQENKIAQYINSSYSFYNPIEGWKAWVKDENKYYKFDGSSWTIDSFTGDMEKSVYDTDDDGIVDKAGILTDGGSGNEVNYTQAQDAVDKKHAQNGDTALGAQSENLNMNTHKIVGVVDPVADQDVETKKHVADNFAPIASPTFTTKITTPIIDLTGGQITFPATAVPSADPNTIDDYEEGTWTPTYITSAVAFDVVTYDAITGGRYIKIGGVIHIQGYIMTDSIIKGSASGNVLLSNLPFTSIASSGSTANGASALSLSTARDWLGEVPSGLYVQVNDTSCRILYRAAIDGDTANTVVADMDTVINSNNLLFGGTYIAAN